MIVVDDDIIINVLAHRQEIEESLKQRRSSLFSIYDSLEKEIYSSITLSGVCLKEISVQTSRSNGGLADISIRIKKEIEEQQNLITQELLGIQLQLETINRIWICYAALPLEQKNLLTALYVEKQKWKSQKKALSQISEVRKKALNQIKNWCNDTKLTNAEIISIGQRNMLTSTKQPQKRHIKTQIDGQLSFFDGGGLC